MTYKKPYLINKSLFLLTFFNTFLNKNFCNFATNPNKKVKVFFPSKIPYIEDLHKNKDKNMKIKRIVDILNANHLYYNLYKKHLKEKDIMEIVDYIHKYYTYHEVHKKALLVAIYRLSFMESYENIEKLQDILYDFYPDTNDLDVCFGAFVLLSEKVLHFNDDIQNNINIILDMQNTTHYYYCSDKPQFEFINYIVQYFLCEYYLVHGIEAFNCNKYLNSIVYLKKVLLRANSHPKCALEALLLMIEIFCILNNELLVEKYFNVLKEICLLNKDEKLMENYYLRGSYILKVYKFNEK